MQKLGVRSLRGHISPEQFAGVLKTDCCQGHETNLFWPRRGVHLDAISIQIRGRNHNYTPVQIGTQVPALMTAYVLLSSCIPPTVHRPPPSGVQMVALLAASNKAAATVMMPSEPQR